MIELETPRGLPVQVPETPEEDPSSRFHKDQRQEIASYYAEHGYVIVEGVVDSDRCDVLRRLWDAEVKPFGGYIYRQATARAERHGLNERGWVMNPILNLQSLDPRRFPRFRSFATNDILTAPDLVESFCAVLDSRPKIVQSMYFEGNSATWEHQDTYYLDSENIGTMAAAWIALEDIAPRAGRFFICPGSHRIDLGEQTHANNIAEHHEDYIQSVVRKVRELGLEIRAPMLQKGDVLLWNSRTIHGSLDSRDVEHSRSSVTCHAIPAADRFLQLQTRVLDVKTTTVNDVAIYRPKDLAVLSNRGVLYIESRFPRAFYALKRLAIKWRIRLKAVVPRPADRASTLG